MNRKSISIFGIIVCILYFIAMLGLIISGSRLFLITFELSTMIAGIFMVLLILILPYSKENESSLCQKMALVSAAGCMFLTNCAHIVNLSVTAPLIQKGVAVPEFLQIGKWPSVEMAVDYLAWGLFTGLAFIFASLAVTIKTKHIKMTLMICGVLCLIGFFGAFLINENLWYIAPCGYGIGTLILCVQLLLVDKKKR